MTKKFGVKLENSDKEYIVTVREIEDEPVATSSMDTVATSMFATSSVSSVRELDSNLTTSAAKSNLIADLDNELNTQESNTESKIKDQISETDAQEEVKFDDSTEESEEKVEEKEEKIQDKESSTKA